MLATVNLYYVWFIITALAAGTASCFRDPVARNIGRIAMGPLLVTFLLMIVSRPIFSDSRGYQIFFNSDLTLGSSVFEAGFELYTMVLAQIGNWPLYLLTFPIFLLAGALYLYTSLRRVPDYHIALFILLVWPFVWAYSATGFRQTLAISIGLVAIAAMTKGRLLIAGSLLFLATFFHSTAVILALCGVAYWRRATPNSLLVVWLVSIIAGAIFPTEAIFAQLLGQVDTFSKYDNYFNEGYGTAYNSGLRLDFLLFSVIPIAAFYFHQPSTRVIASRLDIAFKSYLLLNSFANLMANIPYNDRIYSYSWLLAPILVASMWEENHQITRVIITASLVFLAITYSTRWIGL